MVENVKYKVSENEEIQKMYDERVELKPETCCCDKMLPCPFCGAEPTMTHYPTLTIIECEVCNIPRLTGHGSLSSEQLKDGICYLDIINKWNSRK